MVRLPCFTSLSLSFPRRLPSRHRFFCCTSHHSPSRPFFLNTNLSRHAPHSIPHELDKLLRLPVLFLPIWRDKPLVRLANDHTPSIPVFWTPDQLRVFLRTTSNPLSVPLSRMTSPSTQYFAVDVSHAKSPPVSSGEHAMSLRSVLPKLSETHANLVAHGNALLSWHASALFCSRCSIRTEVTQAGAARKCPNPTCQTRNIYPRVMPSIMAAVTRPQTDEILLGRKTSWKPGRYSVLAGFAEIFEGLEDTVIREVFEETGVTVQPDSIRYVASQPWPSSPHASLMSGFLATVEGEQNARITVDENELEDARWFEKETLRKSLDCGTIDIPGNTSLARRLILDWLNEDIQNSAVESKVRHSTDNGA